MEKRAVSWKVSAVKALNDIEKAIALDKPDTAVKFGIELRNVGKALGDFSNFAPCRYQRFKEKGFFCYPYKLHYVFVYSVTDTTIFILNVIHTSRLQ